MSKKVLVIGGTHEREKEFSHPTIDKLLEIYKVDFNPLEYYGEDGARKSLLWNINDKISVAKIIKTGSLSEDYVKDMNTQEKKLQVLEFIEN